MLTFVSFFDILTILTMSSNTCRTLEWCHNERFGVCNHRRLDSLHNRLFRRRSKKTSKFRVTGLCEGKSTVNGEFPAQRVSNAENVSIWWRHHGQSLSWLQDLRIWKRFPHYWPFLRKTHHSQQKRSIIWSVGVFFIVGLNKLLTKQSSCLRHNWFCFWTIPRTNNSKFQNSAFNGVSLPPPGPIFTKR